MLSSRIAIKNDKPVNVITIAAVLHSNSRVFGADLVEAIILRPPEGVECLYATPALTLADESLVISPLPISLFRLRPKSSGTHTPFAMVAIKSIRLLVSAFLGSVHCASRRALRLVPHL